MTAVHTAARPIAAPAGRVTLKLAIDTTTPAAVLLTGFAPALLGVLLAVERVGRVSPMLTVLLLAIPSLMNAAVASINDYVDYINGNDDPFNIAAEYDGPLAYHQVEDPKPVLYFGVGLLVAAGLMGAYVVWVTGPLPAAIGMVGAVIALTYSGGKYSISHLPIGEPVSGFTLGGLVPLGVYAALTGEVELQVLYKAIPMMMIVAQFMLANNTCDMDRDRYVGRKTLPILIGRAEAQRVADILNIVWIGQLILVVANSYEKGLPVLVLALLTGVKGLFTTFRYDRTQKTKLIVTLALAQVAAAVAIGYPMAVAVHLLLS